MLPFFVYSGSTLYNLKMFNRFFYIIHVIFMNQLSVLRACIAFRWSINSIDWHFEWTY